MAARGSASVLFVVPPGGVVPGFTEHLGVAFLRAVLARAGIGSRQLLARELTLPGFARLLERERPAVVGFTAYESNWKGCRALARVARQALPGAVLLAGGPNATFSPEETLDLLGVDAVLRGAGEGTIAAVAGAVLGGSDARRRLPGLLAGVENLVLRTPDGPRRTAAGDLSSFPSAHFACLDDIPSPYQDGLVETAEVGLITARGCNQHCTYCSFAAISGRKVHHHGVERVLADWAVLRRLAERTGSRQPIEVNDDAFTLAPERARAICEGIVRRGLEHPFTCETRADRVDADLLRLLRRAGCTGVAFGLESGVPRVLRAIGKVRDPDAPGDPGFVAERRYLERFREAVEEARAAGLLVAVSVIGGLPGERPDDFRATLDLVESLHLPAYSHNVLMLFPGTPLHRDRLRAGLDAGRQAATGWWWTSQAHDALAIPPRRGSSLVATKVAEGQRIADALCGRPHPEEAGPDGAWAVVVHGRAPDAALAGWLGRVLAVNGSVLVLLDAQPFGPTPTAEWVVALDAAGVAYEQVVLLVAEQGGLRAVGTAGRHRFALEPAWRPADDAVRVDAAGGCQVALWVASAAAHPPGDPGGLVGATVQVADGCRWWDGWRRCRRPRVLHVGPGPEVRACWGGPPVGKVGDDYAALAAGGAGLGPGDRCPLGPAAGAAPGPPGSAERCEVAAQLTWTLGLAEGLTEHHGGAP